MNIPQRRPLLRHVFAFCVASGLVVCAALLARSPGLAIAAACGGSAGIAALMFILYRFSALESRGETSLDRIRPYGERLPIYDKESGFYADWYFGLRLREEIARSGRYGEPFTLLLIEDLQQGLGESLRKLVFRCLDSTIRDTDMVAHLNNRRFAVLLTNTSLEGGLVAVRRIRENLQPTQIHVGIACYPEDGPNTLSLLTAAGASPDLISSVIKGVGSVQLEGGELHAWRAVPAGEASETEEEEEIPADDAKADDGSDKPAANIIHFPTHRNRCAIPGCERPHHERGLCSRHYAKMRGRAA